MGMYCSVGEAMGSVVLLWRTMGLLSYNEQAMGMGLHGWKTVGL